MNLRLVVAATFVLGITACATSTPQQAVSSKPTEPVATAETSVTESGSAAAEGELQVVDVPNVTATPAVATSQNSELVCRYERELGSHMRTRVCRWRRDIEDERQKTQQTLRQMSRGVDTATSE